MHLNQAIVLATSPMRKLSEAFSPKRRKTDASGHSKAGTWPTNRLPTVTTSSPTPNNTTSSTKSSMKPATQTQMYESDVRLLPRSNCFKCHGKGKSALRRDQDPELLTKQDCGYYENCYEAFLSPLSAVVVDYRLETSDSLHDLKRWLTSPNQRVSGESCELRADDAHFITRSLRFEEQHLAECILWAAEEIKQLHSIVHGQIAYLGAQPYNWTFFHDPIQEASPLDTLPTPQGLKGLSREDLVHLLEEAAVEMDYLQAQICFIRKEILQLKWQNAKKGHWGEIKELLESGWVDVENVQRECRV